MLPSWPQVTSRCSIASGDSPTTTDTRRTSSVRCRSVILPIRLRSMEMTHDVRLATRGRPWSSTIRPRCGCTTMSRTDWSAAIAW